MIWALALYSLVFWGSLRFFYFMVFCFDIRFLSWLCLVPMFCPSLPPLSVSPSCLSSVCLTCFHFLRVSSLVSPVCHLLPCLLVPFPNVKLTCPFLGLDARVTPCFILRVSQRGSKVLLPLFCYSDPAVSRRCLPGCACSLCLSVHCCFQVTMFLDFCSVRVSALVQRFKNGINCLGIRPIFIQ